MQKLILLLLLSLGLIGNSYADIRHCSLEEAQSRGLERCYLTHEHDEYYVEWKCNEGYIKYENRCFKEGELPQEVIEKEIAEFEEELAHQLALDEAIKADLFTNPYADVMICPDDKDRSSCFLPPSSMKIDNWECNEGYVRFGNRCLKEGETPQEEFKKIILDENGQKKWESVNKDGKLFKLTLFYKNGQKEIETVNIFDNGYWNEYFSWHENGQKESEYSYNKENKKDGKWTYWNEDGEITSEVVYKDGVCLSGDCPN